MTEIKETLMVPLKGKAAELARDVLQTKCDFIIQDVQKLRERYDNVIFLVPDTKLDMAKEREAAKKYAQEGEAEYRNKPRRGRSKC